MIITKKSYIFFLMAKSDTFEKFKIFKILLKMEKITLRCSKLIGVEIFYPTNSTPIVSKMAYWDNSQFVLDFMGEYWHIWWSNIFTPFEPYWILILWNEQMKQIYVQHCWKKKSYKSTSALGLKKSIGLHVVQFHQDANIMIIYSFGLHLFNLVYSIPWN
jgi:hypothetical protein